MRRYRGLFRQLEVSIRTQSSAVTSSICSDLISDRDRLIFSNFDRFVFAHLYRITPDVLKALEIVKPETAICWHRAGFRLFWRWKSRCRGGRPKVPIEIRQLIRDMSL